ncbi:MAG: hypothetical protein D6791_16640 [Chloroflexi bacterium]|nr:MAG: hypothetical protein D6791_16640 [Chloroflexota bacterium]
MANNGRRPNVIILILDTVRARSVSAYGCPVKTTPNLDTFAADNILFQHAFTTSTWTIPTHASILSGLYLSQHRIESIKADRLFHKSLVTMPEALRLSGYRTAAFSQNILFSPWHHMDAGFDEFYEVDTLLRAGRLTRGIQKLSEASADKRPVYMLARYVRKVLAPRILLKATREWLMATKADAPIFLMVNISNAHQPWAPPPDILLRHIDFHPRYLLNGDFTSLDQWKFNSGRRKITDTHRSVWRSLYHAAIRHVDREVGWFLKQLRLWTGWDNTIVVITADHGEMLGEYRNIAGHTLSLHDNILRVPLVVRHPDHSSGLVVEQVVQTLDLYPSVLEWAAVPANLVPSAQRQRPSLSTAIAAAEDKQGVAFAEEDYSDSYDVIEGLLGVNPDMDPHKYPRRQIAIRSATHKYIWYDDRPGEFYDLTQDPEEQHNLLQSEAVEDQAILKELQRALESWRSNLEIFPPQIVDGKVEEMDATVIERLRALGYIA